MVWFTLFLFVTSFLLTVFLYPKPEIEDARRGTLGDIRFPRATAGSPAPLLFGRLRVRSANTAWFGNFATITETVKVKTGLFSSKDQIIGYKYCVTMDLAVCCGPNVSMYGLWLDKAGSTFAELNGDGITKTIGIGEFGGVIRFYSGDFTQSRNALISSVATNGADLPAYRGICHIAFETKSWTIKLPFGLPPITFTTPFYIGESPSLSPLSFDLSRYPDNLGLGANRLIGDDINPAEILYSLLIEEWGGLGVDSVKHIDIASFTAGGTTLKTEGNGASFIVTSANEAKSVISEVLRQIDGLLYPDSQTGRIVLKLIRDDYSIPALPVFDETNVESVENFSRTTWSDTANLIRLIYNSRARSYNEATAIAQDGANIAMQNRVKPLQVNFPGVTEKGVANKIVARELSQNGVPLFSVRIRATREASSLKPGDPFVFSWDEYNISSVVMRVQSFDFGELAEGRIVMDCIQDRFAISDTVFADPEDGLDDPGTLVAQLITDYLVFESPYFFVNSLESPFEYTASSSYLWAIARDPTSYHDGFSLLTSDDDFDLNIVTDLDRASFVLSALLQSDIPKTMSQRTGIIDEVVVYSPDPAGAIFGTYTLAELREGKGLLVINGEFMAYEDFTDEGDGTYTLENVHRALLDTTFEAHAADNVCYVITGVEWLGLNAKPYTGTEYYQLLSFTATDSQDLDDFTTQTITNTKRYDNPLPPDLMDVDSIRTPIEILRVSDVDVTDFLERDRTDSEVTLLSDATDTPEASTTYTARLYLNGVLLDTNTGITLAGLPSTLTGLDHRGTARVEIETIRPSLVSHSVEWVEFFYANYPSQNERLTNGDFESAIAFPWVEVVGNWNNVATAFPLDPVLTVGGASDTDEGTVISGAGTNELRQNYTIPGGDAGKAALFRVWKGGGDDQAVGQIVLEIRDASSALKTVTTTNVAATRGEWELIEIPFSYLSSATTIRVKIFTTGVGGHWDNASLLDHTTSPTSSLEHDTITNVTVDGLWALRLADSGYSGDLVRIRDTYDDSEQDVGFDEDGNLEAFWVRGEARVVKVYDQSGNGIDLTAPADANEPLLVWNMTETGRPYIWFDGADKQLEDPTAGTTRAYMVTRPNMLFASGPKKDTSQDFIASIATTDGTHGSSYRWGLDGNTDWGVWLNGSATNDAGATAPSGGKSVWWLDYQNGLGYHNEDTTSTVSWTAANVTYPNSTRLKISGAGDDTLGWDGGTFSELVIFDGNIAAGDRQTMMEGLSEYWYNFTA
jgi:hypothetical protein